MATSRTSASGSCGSGRIAASKKGGGASPTGLSRPATQAPSPGSAGRIGGVRGAGGQPSAVGVGASPAGGPEGIVAAIRFSAWKRATRPSIA